MMLINGTLLALIEISIFTTFSFMLKKYSNKIKHLNNITYFWLCFTVLTGIWEFFFIIEYKNVIFKSNKLLQNNSHVWTKSYDISYLLPNNFSKIFYAEYGAYADRMYMTNKGIWCRIIESTHSLFCGLFALLALIYYYKVKNNVSQKYVLFMSVAMGSQLMNSLLYTGNYFIEVNTLNNVNYNTSSFPTGTALIKRPFMYVNIFWTILPIYVIIQQLHTF